MSKYVVTAPRKIMGHEPDEEFEAELSEGQEERLIASGALKLVGGKPKQEKDAEKPSPPPKAEKPAEKKAEPEAKE